VRRTVAQYERNRQEAVRWLDSRDRLEQRRAPGIESRQLKGLTKELIADGSHFLFRKPRISQF
jgi:hypothetical protein